MPEHNPVFSAADHRWMAEALRLAKCGLNTTTPNPAVGCVIVKDDACIGRGWHVAAGQAHAEVNALREAAAAAAGATAYVTLEPCSAHGRTPPCVEALVKARVARVVFAMRDPNPDVDGAGMQALAHAGVQVEGGLMAASAARLNEGFALRMRSGRPFVTAKIAASLDGATAMRSGESQWITGPAARADVQRLRARACAVVTGIGTVLADDPSLNVRGAGVDAEARQPWRVILDSQLRMPPSARVLSLPGAVMILSTQPDAAAAALLTSGATHHQVPDAAGVVDLSLAMGCLASHGINEVLLEAGERLTGAFATAGLIDRYVLYLAPRLLGSETRGILQSPSWLSLADGVQLRIEDVTMVGEDLRIQAVPEQVN